MSNLRSSDMKPAPERSAGFVVYAPRTATNHPEFIVTFTVAVTASLTKLTVLMTAPAAGVYQGRLLDTAGNEVQKTTSADPSFEFKGVAASSTFTAEVSRLDANGAVIPDSVATLEVVTPADGVSTPTTADIDVPSALTVTVTQE